MKGSPKDICREFTNEEVSKLITARDQRNELISLLGKRRIVTLCGSSRFMEEHMKAQKELTLQGKIVIPMGMFGHREVGFDMDGPIKVMLDQLHFDKIALSHEIFVVNPRVLTCYKCKKPCESGCEPTYLFPPYSKCCQAEVNQKPYIGESTRNEIEYAKSLGKVINYLNPME